MNGQFYQTVELEQQWLEERNAKRREHAQEQAREMLTDEQREELEQKYPYLRSWKPEETK